MERLEIEVYSEETNRAIVRMPGRQYPGIVIQGDTMSGYASHAEEMFQRAKKTDDEELVLMARDLKDDLNDLLLHYEIILGEVEIPLPYSKKPFNVP